MRLYLRSCLIGLLCGLLVLIPACSHTPKIGAPAPPPPSGLEALAKDIRKPYLKLFKISPELSFSNSQITQMHQFLQKGQDYCVGQFKAHAKKLNSEIAHEESLAKPGTAGREDGEQHALQCKIRGLRLLESQAKVLYKNAIPTAYANRQAKLELIQKWPSDLKQIKNELVNGQNLRCHWCDVKDIGFRVIAKGQKNDIPLGEREVKQMKQSGMMPPAVKDKAIDNYVNSVAQKVAKHSDLHIPLHVTVLNAKEINAFSLPGGYIFVERGLLQAVDNESELAGVIGHEIGHVVARHGHKLMHKQEVAGIFYNAAQVAALVLTGGIASIGAYYALQYGFYGLGMVMNLRMLGISREFEMQADQLGIQYAWNSGYDPYGFIKFFDKMATNEGYVNGVSWFHTHPPFYQRMVHAMQVIMFLPKKPHYIVNTTAFMKMKKELKKVSQKAKQREKNAPSLEPGKNVKGCAPPRKYEFKPNQPIEDLCRSPKMVTEKKAAEQNTRGNREQPH